jgi:hypothetical protein
VDVSSFDKTHTMTSDDMVRGTRIQNFHIYAQYVCSPHAHTPALFFNPLGLFPFSSLLSQGSNHNQCLFFGILKIPQAQWCP